AARDRALRDPELAAHLDSCSECARFLALQEDLCEGFASIAADHAGTPAPAWLETKVLAAFDGQTAARPIRWWMPVSAVLASGGAAALLLIHSPTPAPHPMPFLAVPYVAPLAPYERAEVVRMDVPVAALMAMGVEVHVADSTAAIQADVLVGQDGRPLAFRP